MLFPCENPWENSGECSKRFRGMLSKAPGNSIKDSGECSRRFRKCSERFRGMLSNIPENVFNFKSIKATFYLKKANAKLISEAWSIFALSTNETTERSNKMIWYFHFFWNSSWKEIARPWEKANKEKLKSKTNRRRKWIKEMKVIRVPKLPFIFFLFYSEIRNLEWYQTAISSLTMKYEILKVVPKL